jgi:toxin CptA
LTIINLTVAGARLRRSLVVAPDSLRTDEFRRLRVWLRWRGTPGEVPDNR